MLFGAVLLAAVALILNSSGLAEELGTETVAIGSTLCVGLFGFLLSEAKNAFTEQRSLRVLRTGAGIDLDQLSIMIGIIRVFSVKKYYWI